jgi:hypothetical protein
VPIVETPEEGTTLAKACSAHDTVLNGVYNVRNKI